MRRRRPLASRYTLSFCALTSLHTLRLRYSVWSGMVWRAAFAFSPSKISFGVQRLLALPFYRRIEFIMEFWYFLLSKSSYSIIFMRSGATDMNDSSVSVHMTIH
jgi:hypothetical protein